MFEIGNSLREARLRRELELVDAEHGTKIRGKYLRALEDERFEVLPAHTYVKGFLRAYADYLGLDGQLYVDEYNSRYVIGEEEPQSRPRRSAAPSRGVQVQSRVVLLTLLGIVSVTALVIVAWTSGSPSEQHVSGLAPTTTAKEKPKRARQETAPAPRKARITLKAVRSSVLLLAVRKGGPTGRILLENVELAPGEAKKFKRVRLWINTGTPGNLRVVVNGKRVTYPGGKPQAFIVTAGGISASA